MSKAERDNNEFVRSFFQNIFKIIPKDCWLSFKEDLIDTINLQFGNNCQVCTK